ncbi:HAMP domain-containing histidine kinase [Lysinibacillus telephonicus]|uniref:Signal transduction histidine-protein kinase ArlS n=1 Tax=Lysinibacillus telephonicus TaxID=1714840 RepID=A0A431UJ83_9BACI|nr:HAMP domain-containing histidine kinase [Lysinibacillus telephonicus]RTQ89612.1 HAMP domain-containing histidine kinase [Lysinibacillus telephonicus]
MKNLKYIVINQSLKKKWIMSTAIVIFISYAAICTVIYLALYSWLLQNEENNAIRTADDLTSFFNSQNESISISEFQGNTGLFKAIVNQNQTVYIFNQDGYEVLRINNKSSAADIVLSYDQLRKTVISKEVIDNEDVFVVNKFVNIGRFHGVMQLIHPLTTFQSMMQYVLTTMLIAGLGAILLAVSIGYYLANLLIRPIQDLRDSMMSVRDKGFDKEINFAYNADDEIGDLLKIYRTMIAELQSTFAKQQQFVSDASHELRTPIQAIEGHLSLIKRWGKNDPDVLEESISTSLEEVTRMKKMIEELLDLARKEERDEHAVTNVEKVLYSVKEELEVIYTDASIHISTTGEPLLPNITENALGQIARNIIENGIRYNDRKPIIDIDVQYLSKKVVIMIKDNGIGISKEHLPHIFDRFYRVDASRENTGGGTGLGLSITKMLAEKYDVEIDVQSSVGKGTTFTLNFSL